MFGVELICSDESCAEVSEVTVFSLEELSVLTCDSCGCILQSLNVWKATELRLSQVPASHLPQAA